MNLPRRVFLDTNVVNFILDHDGSIFESEEIPAGLPERDAQDIESLRCVFATGERAHWELAVSLVSYEEISATSDPDRRRRLERFFSEIWQHWRGCFAEDGTLSDDHAVSLAEKLVTSELLAAFPDETDRHLICHAIAYECDAICTRDHKTILKRRQRVATPMIDILSPTEWWNHLKPYCGLWI